MMFCLYLPAATEFSFTLVAPIYASSHVYIIMRITEESNINITTIIFEWKMWNEWTVRKEEHLL